MIYSLLNDYLSNLDRIKKYDDSSIFSSKRDKEVYETYLMFAFERYKAAKYHAKNIETLIENEKQKATKFNMDKSVNIKHSSHNSSFSHELSAFLVALRSGVDFSVKNAQFHIKGIELDSVRVLKKGLKKGKEDFPIYRIVNKHLEWIEFLKDYRDKIVHKSTIITSSSYELTVGTEDILYYPITVPTSPPKFKIDTRESRAFFNEEFNVDSTTSCLTFTNGKEVIKKELKKSLKPSVDRIEILEFTRVHLANFENFFNDLLKEYENLDYKTIILK